jgi:2-C-methyl-D-erythritol 4-phosphate cytidylyltransferase
MRSTPKAPGLTAVVVAAGEGRRMGGVSKVWRALGGKPVWWWSLAAFSNWAEAAVLVVAAERAAEAAAANPPLSAMVVSGGDSRSESVRRGLAAVETAFVAVHDGARPLVTDAVIGRVWAAASVDGAAIPAVVPTDTVKLVRDGRVAATLPRTRLRLAQTPEMFRTDWLRKALEAAPDTTDDSAAVEALGYSVTVVEGAPDNRKLTVEDDWTWIQSRFPAGRAP